MLSIQVCIGLKVVKDWGLHPTIEHSTLEDIFKRLQSGQLKGVSRVSLEIPDDADFKCMIALSTKGHFRLYSTLPRSVILLSLVNISSI